MGGVIGQILPFAVAVAISPVPIIAVILMSFSARAGANGPAFLGGWVTGLLAVSVVVLVFTGIAGIGTGTTPLWAALLQLVLGVVLLLLGWEKLTNRPPAGSVAPLPKWLQAVDQMPPGTAFGMGALLSGVNPKNLVLTAAAALVIAQSGLSGLDTAIAVVAFICIGSASIGLPVAYHRFGGASAKVRLTSAKAWLGENNSAVMAVLCLIFGVVLIGKGIGAL